MTCERGCCPSQREHYQSLTVAHPDRDLLQKVTTDDHGTHQVDVVEHYPDRQDVTVRVPRVVAKATTSEQKD
jgi:hypothetical protein